MLVSEAITGRSSSRYFNRHMRRGTADEPIARNVYEYEYGLTVQQVGFVRNGNIGASPDGLIGDKGGVEFKSALPHIQNKRLLSASCPLEHYAQVQGCMYVCNREWWDLVSYCRGMDIFRVRVQRDETFIKKLAAALVAFNNDLAAALEIKLRGQVCKAGYDTSALGLLELENHSFGVTE